MASADNADKSSSNITERRQPVKKKPRLSANSSRTSTPNVYSRRSPPREQGRPREPSPIINDNDDNSNNNDEASRSPPRKLKRPGAGARIAASNREAAEAARKRRDEEDKKAVTSRQTHAAELVASHYNAVPERGREWRKTDSQIKGLRSLNNWVKSTLIQKFSLPEDAPPGQSLLVLDMACGKGGDLGKWEKAPVVPGLYVGCDIADVSVEQARIRWDESLRKSRGKGRRGGEEQMQMQAEFYVHDAFSRSLSDIPRIRQVGFNPNAGPAAGAVIQPGMGSGGFDVVSMMFALHYSYESEVLARGMLKNVAGALKKGGRFIGVMPDSDVISATVKRLLLGDKTSPNGKDGVEQSRDGEEEGEIKEGEADEEDDWDPEKPSEPANGVAASGQEVEEEDDWDPEKPSEPQQQQATTANGTAAPNSSDELDVDDWDPEKPSDSTPNATTTSAQPPIHSEQQPNSTSPIQPTPSESATSHLPPLEWGNTLYTIRFPRTQPLTKRPLPADGIFRPPYGWRYHYHLAEAVDVPEYVVPWEAFRALAEEYGLELLYRKGFREVLEDEGMGDVDRDGNQGELRRLAERMGVLRRDGGLMVGEEEMEAAGFYHAFCFYRM